MRIFVFRLNTKLHTEKSKENDRFSWFNIACIRSKNLWIFIGTQLLDAEYTCQISDIEIKLDVEFRNNSSL